MTEAEERALLHQDQALRRAAFQRQLAARLRGSEAARKTLHDNWKARVGTRDTGEQTNGREE